MQKQVPRAATKYIRELIATARESQNKYEQLKGRKEQELAWYYRGRAEALENIIEFLEKM